MLGIMASINQKDFFALIVDNGSCMVEAGFTGYDTPRACSLWFAGMPVMFGIMACMNQKNTCSSSTTAVARSRLVLLGTIHLMRVLLVCRHACDVRHHGRYGPEEHVFQVIVAVYGESLCATTCALHTCSSSTRSSSSISWRSGCFPWSVCSSRPSRFPIAVYGGRCPCCAGRANSQVLPSDHS